MSKRIEADLERIAQQALENLSALNIDGAALSLSREKGFSVDVRSGDVETVSHHLEKSFSVTVYSDHRTGSASSSDFSSDAVLQAIQKAYAIAQYANPDPYAGLPDKNRLALYYPDCHLSHPWDLSVDEAIDKAIACEKIALAADSQISQSEGVSISTFQSDYLLANTLGFIGQYPMSEHMLHCSLIAKKSDQMQRDDEYTIARDPGKLLNPELIAKRAAQKTVARLGAKRLKTQSCPVVYDAPVAKSLLRSFVAAISGGNLYRQSSFLLDAIGQRIFPDFITVSQNPHLSEAMGSAPFDAEGVVTDDHVYVDCGELKSYALGSYSARKLGLTTTGNAGGVFNLEISDSGISQADLLKKMGRGLLVTELMGQGVNITTGDYSRGAAGFWVENGEIQYPVEEITIAGNLKNMFQSIVAIADDTDTRGSIRTGSILIDAMTIAGE